MSVPPAETPGRLVALTVLLTSVHISATGVPLFVVPGLQNFVSNGLCAGPGRYLFPGVGVGIDLPNSEIDGLILNGAEVRCDDCDGESPGSQSAYRPTSIAFPSTSCANP
jgi:hypothetical protein